MDQVLLMLLKKSLFGIDIAEPISSFAPSIDWQDVLTESSVQSIKALALQGLVCFPKVFMPQEDLLYEWKGQVFKEILSNERLISEQSEVLKILSNAGIKTAVLKGTSSSRFYPKPELRVLGDIDLLIDPHDMDLAISALQKNGYFKNKVNTDYHVSLEKDVNIELHHQISNLLKDDKGKKIRDAMTDVLDNIEICTLDNARFPCLSPFHNALVLLLHMEKHIKSSGIGLRHLCDWAVFANSNPQPELWGRLLPFLKEIRLYTFTIAVTKACVIYLGLNKDNCAWCIGADSQLCERVMQEILDSGNFGRKTGPERETSGYMASGFIYNLNRSIKKAFPFCEKYPILLPLFWAYIPVRYLYRMLTGKRPKQSAIKVANLARKRKKLFVDLGIYNN